MSASSADGALDAAAGAALERAGRVAEERADGAAAEHLVARDAGRDALGERGRDLGEALEVVGVGGLLLVGLEVLQRARGAISVNAAAMPTPASLALATPPAMFVVVPSSRASSAIVSAPTFARSSMNASDSWPRTRIENAPSTATSAASVPVSVTFRTSVCTSASIVMSPAASIVTRSSMYARA